MRNLDNRIKRLEGLKNIQDDGFIVFVSGLCEVAGEKLTEQEYDKRYPNHKNYVRLFIEEREDKDNE